MMLCCTLDIDECATNSHNCEQTCVNIPGGFSCECLPGYTPVDETACAGKELEDTTLTLYMPKLLTDYSQCCCFISVTIDVNECETLNGGCQQTCTNTDGSFFCNCTEGYELEMDGTTCLSRLLLEHSWEILKVPNHVSCLILVMSLKHIMHSYSSMSDRKLPLYNHSINFLY